MKETQKIKVAAANSWAEPLAIEQNIDGIASMLSAFSIKGVDYALFPELSVSGYFNNSRDLQLNAQKHEQILVDLKALSEKHPFAFSVGLPMPLERHWGIAQLTFNKGEIINIHTKTHLSVHEQEVFKAGTSLQPFHVGQFSIGMQLCLESHFPELSLAYQQKGTNLLCFAFASPRETPKEKYNRFLMMLQTRAYDNGCFLMACNLTGKTQSGKSYAGTAMIISPRGKVLASCTGTQADYCTADLSFSDIIAIKNSQMSNFPAYRKTKTKVTFKDA
jgi:N-carbamoylputrescine amidase